jgi:hypothetical protein
LGTVDKLIEILKVQGPFDSQPNTAVHNLLLSTGIEPPQVVRIHYGSPWEAILQAAPNIIKGTAKLIDRFIRREHTKNTDSLEERKIEQELGQDNRRFEQELDQSKRRFEQDLEQEKRKFEQEFDQNKRKFEQESREKEIDMNLKQTLVDEKQIQNIRAELEVFNTGLPNETTESLVIEIYKVLIQMPLLPESSEVGKLLRSGTDNSTES